MKQRPAFPARLEVVNAQPSAAGKKAVGGGGKPPGLKGTTGMSTLRATPGSPAVRPRGAMPMPTARVTFAAEAPVARIAAAGVGLDSHAVRMNMVHKLVQDGVSDAAVLAAFRAIERHRFVDTALVGQAYEDTSLPIGLGQTISKPGVVARMLELLRHGRPGKLGRVLEIGTGCGYQAALLGQLASEVYSIERLRGLHDKARDNLRHLRLTNVHLLFGDGMAGYAKGAPYAAIIAAAGGAALPQAWVDQLAVGGRLVAPMHLDALNGGLGSRANGAPMGQNAGSGKQVLLVIDRTPTGLHQTILESVQFVPLKSGVA